MTKQKQHAEAEPVHVENVPELPPTSEPEMMDISANSSMSGMGMLDTTLMGWGQSDIQDLEASYKGDAAPKKVGGRVAGLCNDYQHLCLQAPQGIADIRPGKADKLSKATKHGGLDCNIASHYHEVPPPKEYQEDAEKQVQLDNSVLASYYNKEDRVKQYLELLCDQETLSGPEDYSPEKADSKVHKVGTFEILIKCFNYVFRIPR